MHPKRILTLVLSLLIVASVAAVVFKEIKSTPLPAEAPSSLSTPATGDVNHQVVAYYFHGALRCVTCQTIEAYTDKALRHAFTNELKNGELVWLPLNVQEPQHQHFIDDYQLITQSVVLVEMKNGNPGRWKNLKDVWTLVDDQEEFFAYIQNETCDFLAGASS